MAELRTQFNCGMIVGSRSVPVMREDTNPKRSARSTAVRVIRTAIATSPSTLTVP
jgi:hypothetical protein